MSTMNRRRFLGTAAAAAASSLAPMKLPAQLPVSPEPETIVDTHVHFYDPSRPGGVPGLRRATPGSTARCCPRHTGR